MAASELSDQEIELDELWPGAGEPRVFLAESEQRCGCGHDHAASYGPLLAS
jgi:hypothetical protein